MGRCKFAQVVEMSLQLDIWRDLSRKMFVNLNHNILNYAR